MNDNFSHLYSLLKSALFDQAYHLEIRPNEKEISLKQALCAWRNGKGFHAVEFNIKEEFGVLYLAINVGLQTEKDGFRYLADWEVKESFENNIAALSIGLPALMTGVLHRKTVNTFNNISRLVASLRYEVSSSWSSCLSKKALNDSIVSGAILRGSEVEDFSLWCKRENVGLEVKDINFTSLPILTFEDVELMSKRKEQRAKIFSNFEFPYQMTVKDTGNWEEQGNHHSLVVFLESEGSNGSSNKGKLTVVFKANSHVVSEVVFNFPSVNANPLRVA